jgi:hypothetical protein
MKQVNANAIIIFQTKTFPTAMAIGCLDAPGSGKYLYDDAFCLDAEHLAQIARTDIHVSYRLDTRSTCMGKLPSGYQHCSLWTLLCK